jgi:predicted nucleotidyltransferase
VPTGRGAVQRELANLVEAGILQREEESGRVFFSADPTSPIFADLRAIVEKTAGLNVVVSDALASVEGITVAFVFGSVARGEARSDSDVDVAVIGATSFRKIVSALADAQMRLGREINPVLFSADELRNRIDRDDAFVRELIRGPKQLIIGTEDDLRAVAE